MTIRSASIGDKAGSLSLATKCRSEREQVRTVELRLPGGFGSLLLGRSVEICGISSVRHLNFVVDQKADISH